MVKQAPPTAPTSSAAAPADDAATAVPPTFEAAMAELERLVASMETGQLPLDQLLESYKRGAVLLEHCRGRLDAVEQQVQILEAGQLKAWSNT